MAGDDFVGISDVLSFESCAKRTCINVTIVKDSKKEENESFYLNLTAMEPLHGIVIDRNKTVVTIFDDKFKGNYHQVSF